ncbi:Cytochrome P450 [Lasiodiplodia theobromae]|uniref:Cytochrome P450 n=1 Tax=Lasiodiplodia theobromae TaxID=45133 RepID=UPI0015C309EE|nr:Cytochrome P450 [Lasiodiplodia theobromae]KAF4544390.1 Cytochrome P450 [Lasiodiplodia theobromae]
MPSPAEAPLALSLPLASVVLGAATHISSFRLQLDDYGWRLLGLWNLTLTLLFLWLSRSYDFLAATRLVLTFAATFLFGFFGSTTVYRFFFSPLRKFRGPWQGVLTSLYRLHAAITTDVRLFRSIDSLHKQYGDYVRIGAREISILNPSAIPLLYGAKAQSLADYEPRVQEVINDLIRALEARTGSSVNLTDWISFFAFDAMGRVAYSQEFGMIRDGKGSVTFAGKTTSHEALRATMKMYGIFGPVPWLFKMISQIGLVGEMATFFQWCHSTMRTKQQSFDAINDTPTDISSWIIKSQNDASDINKRPTQRSLENDSILLILAGSDTAASAITNAIFYLTQDPARLAKLRAQLAALPDRSLKSLGTVRYLDHVINETLRLKPPAIEGLVRETPAGGLTLPDGVFVPGGTMVSIPPWTLHRDKRFWGEDADEFRPERFEGVDLTSETVPWMPFTRGAYTCPGKQLAYIEMRGVISAVVMGFDLTLAEGQSPKEFDEGCQDSFTLTNPPLMVDLKKREV